ncbi:hypothetical protein THASP1DRAFT_28404 [Thamnocephalis sphaerospora]|uniref:Uncharacterized protein n=1 Tax=Thamnocephalis sphaerospora TaxID=78915 RepID=A0A4P9XUB9_9FUNG|nr:hypothetical protein THASP1DRAFT_28404 [Thamnocephalis sphaerospora]|eukprot:RKP09817.1 hypothetical protein THASP1DRAFT_28404 [Thamnocephalis sphaerospora]
MDSKNGSVHGEVDEASTDSVRSVSVRNVNRKAHSKASSSSDVESIGTVAVSEPLSLRQRYEIDWFHAYCCRRSTEYRWRTGKYKIYKPNGVKSRSLGVKTGLPGSRLQSILLTPRETSPKSTVVASQWIRKPGELPIWVLEQINWGNMATNNVKIEGIWWSDMYLIVRIAELNADRSVSRISSLCSWHFNGLHIQPNVIIQKRQITSVSIYRSWLVAQYYLTPRTHQYQTVLCNLNKRTICQDILGNKTYCCIQRATNTCAHIICAHRAATTAKQATLICNLWEIVPSRPGVFYNKASSAVKMMSGTDVKAQRIDDKRFVLWSDFNGESPSTSSLVLLELTDNQEPIEMETKWSKNAALFDLQPIVSRNMLAATRANNVTVLQSLEDGSTVQRVHLSCWKHSGLYPLDNQWAKMTDENTESAQAVSIPKISIYAEQVSSPTAALFRDGQSVTLVDYSKSPASKRVQSKVPPDNLPMQPVKSASFVARSMKKMSLVGRAITFPLGQAKR